MFFSFFFKKEGEKTRMTSNFILAKKVSVSCKNGPRRRESL